MASAYRAKPVPLVLLFLLIFRDHLDLRKARTALNILMDITESESCGFLRDLGQLMAVADEETV